MKKYALICEDNQTAAYYIKSMFERLGDYEVSIANTANETFELLKTNNYDLLTLDILLPDMNGLDLLKEIRKLEITRELPVIVISATKKESWQLEEKHDIIYWLEKSFEIDDLEKALDKMIGQKDKNKINVLHVENDEDLLTLVDMSLSDMANVTKVGSLQKAREIIPLNKFDIIILDYVFPEGTSDKLIPLIRSGINKEAKIIMFSAYEENKILANYVDEIIIKTNVSYEEFKQCIENLMKK